MSQKVEIVPLTPEQSERLFARARQKAAELYDPKPAAQPLPNRPKSSCCGGNRDVPVVFVEAKPVDIFAQQQTTRHLAYHIYPVSGNGAWQRNVGRLVERLRIFNGKIIVSVVTDPPSGRLADPTGPHSPDRARQIHGCDSFDDVVKAFGEWANKIEFIHSENDPQLREVATLMPMLERLPQGRGHFTLYAQAKGTTRSPNHIGQHWSDVQYIIYLDYWLLVERQLRHFPVTGAFKKLGPGWSATQSKSDWHYSGSWFWFRNSDLFSRDWRRIDQFWSGIEPYPSQHFEYREAGVLFHEASIRVMNLYSDRYWKRTVNPLFARWRDANRAGETPF